MAGSLADVLIGNAAQQTNAGVDVAGDISSGVKAGVQLATAKEQVESAKTQLEAQKDELITKKASSVNALLTNLARANPAIQPKMVKQVREQLINLGADPDIADYTISDDANRQRQSAFANLASGKLASDPTTAGNYFQSVASVIGYDDAVKAFDAAQKNSTELKKQDNELKKQQLENKGKTDVAEIAGGFRAKAAEGRAGQANDRLLGTSNRLYNKEVAPFQDLIVTGQKTESLIDDIRSGKITSNPNIKADIEDNLSKLSSGKGQTTVSGSVRHELESAQGILQGKINTILGEAGDTIAPKQLDELSRDVKAFNELIQKQHEDAFDSFIAKQPEGVQEKLTEGYNRYRQSKGLKTYGVSSPAISAGAPPASVSAPNAGNADIEAKKQAALKAGYSQAEVDAYVQKLMKGK